MYIQMFQTNSSCYNGQSIHGKEEIISECNPFKVSNPSCGNLLACCSNPKNICTHIVHFNNLPCFFFYSILTPFNSLTIAFTLIIIISGMEST